MRSKMSIIVLAYNQENYVDAFWGSLLQQTEKDFDVVIVDDASTDRTADRIADIKDQRICFIRNQFNHGINASFNIAAAHVQADIISFMALDDMFEANYVERILLHMSKSSEASVCYVALQCIDEYGNKLPRVVNLPEGYSKFEILRSLFFLDNICPSPGMAIRREALCTVVPLSNSLLNYSDMQLHIRLLCAYDMTLLNEPLVLYRQHSGNVSQRSDDVIMRERLEAKQLMDTFIDNFDLFLFGQVFKGQSVLQMFPPKTETLPYCIGQAAMTSDKAAQRGYGYQIICEYLSQPGKLELIHEMYGQDFALFKNLVRDLLFDDMSLQEIKKLKTEKQKLKRKVKKYKILSFVAGLFCCLCAVVMVVALHTYEVI